MLSLLLPFCYPDESRFLLQQPWTDGAFTYATNAKVILRVPAIPEAAPRQPLHPPAETLANNFPPAVATLTQVVLPPGWRELVADRKPCTNCNGTHTVAKLVKCKCCAGDGEVCCDSCSKHHTCLCCDGLGEVEHDTETEPCQKCDDTGHSPLPVIISANDGAVLIDRDLILPVMDLPNVALFFEPTQLYTPVYFTFTGGDGAIARSRDYHPTISRLK